jgi:hypothetical protein
VFKHNSTNRAISRLHISLSLFVRAYWARFGFVRAPYLFYVPPLICSVNIYGRRFRRRVCIIHKFTASGGPPPCFLIVSFINCTAVLLSVLWCAPNACIISIGIINFNKWPTRCRAFGLFCWLHQQLKAESGIWLAPHIFAKFRVASHIWSYATPATDLLRALHNSK